MQNKVNKEISIDIWFINIVIGLRMEKMGGEGLRTKVT